jgi:hypothetical protein
VLKGKPETGINASVTYPHPIIRFPSAAPFEFRLSASGRAALPSPPFETAGYLSPELT